MPRCGPVRGYSARALIAPARPGELALTFDDGPNAAWTPRLLDILAQPRCACDVFSGGQPCGGGAGAGAADRGGRAPDRESLLGHPNLARTRAGSAKNCANQPDAGTDHGQAGEVLPAAFWSAAARVFRIARGWA